MSETTNSETILDLWREVTNLVNGVARQVSWAADEIQKAMERHPAERDVLYHSHSHLRPTHNLMSTEFVFRSHCHELLERLVSGADTRPGTAAEACCICCDISLSRPAELARRRFVPAHVDCRFAWPTDVHRATAAS